MLKCSFREVYRLIYMRKSSFMALLVRHRITKFPTVYPTIYLPNKTFQLSYPLILGMRKILKLHSNLKADRIAWNLFN